SASLTSPVVYSNCLCDWCLPRTAKLRLLRGQCLLLRRCLRLLIQTVQRSTHLAVGRTTGKGAVVQQGTSHQSVLILGQRDGHCALVSHSYPPGTSGTPQPASRSPQWRTS